MAYSHIYANLYGLRQKAGAALSAVWHFRPVRFYLIGALALQILAWWEAFYVFRHLSGNLLVLHYNVDFGVDLVADPSQIFVYPLLGLGLVVLNFIIAAIFSRRANFKILTQTLMAGADLFGLILVLALLSVYLINFF